MSPPVHFALVAAGAATALLGVGFVRSRPFGDILVSSGTGFVLLFLAAALLIVVVFRRSHPTAPDPGNLNDQRPVDGLNGRRRSDRSVKETASSLEDRIDPVLRPSVRKLTSTMPYVVAEGANELGGSGHPDAVPPLLAALHSHFRTVHFAVVAALLRLGSPCLGPLREELAKGCDARLKGIMSRLLEQLDKKAKGLEVAPLEEIVGMPSEVLDELAEGWRSD